MGYIKEKLTLKRVIIAAVIVAAAAAAVTALVLVQKPEPGSSAHYVTRTVGTAHMAQTITASGKVTTGRTETVRLDQSKAFGAMCVEKDELVRKGQPLAYYADGTHTDAPEDGVVKSVSAPKTGAAAGKSDCVRLDSTDTLYLKVMIPEDTVNEMKKGNAAGIVVNAYPGKRFEGKILSIQGMSTGLKSSEQEEYGGDEGYGYEEGEDGAIEAYGDDEGEDYDEGDEEEYYEDVYDEESMAEDESSEDGSGTAYYAVNISFGNDGTVLPGMSASSVITVSDRNDVLAVPVQAVRFDKKRRAYVERADKDKVRKVFVEIGESDPMNVEILDGLSKGDKIRVKKY